MGFKGLGVLSDIGQPTELYDLSISHQHWAHRCERPQEDSQSTEEPLSLNVILIYA